MQRVIFWANLVLFVVLLFLVGLALGGGQDSSLRVQAQEKTKASPSSQKGAVPKEVQRSSSRLPGSIHLVGLPDWKHKIVVPEGGTLRLEKWPMRLGLSFEGLGSPAPMHFEVLDRQGKRTKVRVESRSFTKDGARLNLWGFHPIGKRYILRGSLGKRSFTFHLEGPAPSLLSARIFVRGKAGSFHYHLRLGFNAPVDLAKLRPLLSLETIEGRKLAFSLRPSLGSKGMAIDRHFILTPKVKSSVFVNPQGVVNLRLHLRPGLTLPGQDVEQKNRLTKDLTFGGPIRLAWIKGGPSTLTLCFGKPLMGVDPRKIHLNPRVPFEIETTDRGIKLKGSFQPGKVYHLTLAKGFPGVGAFRLDRKEVRSFRSPDLPWRGDFVRNGNLLSNKALPEIQVQGVNLSKLRLEVRKVLPGNALAFLRNPRAPIVDSAFLGSVHSKVFFLAPRKNELFRKRLDLSSLLPEEREGLFLIRLETTSLEGDQSYWPKQRLLQITGLGAQVRHGAGTLIARVHRLENAAGVKGALVRVLSPKNQVLAYGKTDSHGICRLEWIRGKGREPRMLEIRKGKDQAFVDVDRNSVELAGKGFEGRAFLPEGKVEAYAWTDQGIVRPGREIRAIFLVEDAHGRAPVGEDLRIQWLRPGGRVFRERVLQVPVDGFLREALRVPSYAESGRWGAVLLRGKEVVGRVGFSVKAFVPDRIEVDGGFLGTSVLGRTADLWAQARWLDGGAASGLKTKAKVFLREGDHEVRLDGKTWVVGSQGQQPKKLPAFDAMVAVMSEEGKCRFNISLPPISSDLGGWAQLSLRARIEVADPSGRMVRVWAKTTAKAPRRLLLRRKSKREVEALLIDPNEKVLGGQVSFRLERRWWVREYKVDPRGIGRTQFRLQREVLMEGRRTMGPKELHIALPKLKKLKEGWVVLVGLSRGARTELTLTEKNKSGSELRVIALGSKFESGANLHLRVQSPVKGKALLTFEDRRVLGGQEVSLKKGWNELTVKLPKVRATPNLYVVLGIVASQRGRSHGPYSWTGGVPVFLERKERILRPRLILPSETKPGALIRVQVRAPGARRVFVALVDQGVLRITGHQDPDPLGFFLGKRRLGTRGADSNLAMMEEVRFPQSHATGGGAGRISFSGTGALTGTISPWIQTLALASDLVFPSKGGEAGVFHTEFRLPRVYEGRLRVFAIAAGAKASGAIAKDLFVRAPLSLRLAGPRRLSPGDQCRLSVVVRNLTKQAGLLDLKFQGKGGLEVLDSSFKKLPMKQGEQKVLFVRVRAGKAGAGPQVFKALGRLGTETRMSSLDIDVRPPLFPARRLLGLVLDRGRQRIPCPSSLFPEGRSLKIRVGGDPLERLRPAFRSLMGYPYGCVEQTASKARVLMAFAPQLGRVGGGGKGPSNLREKIGFALDRIAGMTRPYDGMGFWGVYGFHPLPTLHALEFALDAESRGLGRMPMAWRKILKRLGNRTWKMGDQAMNAWTLYVMEKAHLPMRRALEDQLLPSLKDPFGRCWAALALQAMGEDQKAQEVLKGLQGDSFPSSRFYLTPLVGRSLLLRALLKAIPGAQQIPSLAEGIIRSCMDPSRLTTFEVANALGALAQYRETRSLGPLATKVKLHWKGKTKLLGEGEEIKISIPMGEDGPELESDGRAYLLLDWNGYERATPIDPQTKKSFQGASNLDRKVFMPGTKILAKAYKRGEIYEVHMRVETRGDFENICLADLFSGGMEAEEGGSKVLFFSQLAKTRKALKGRALPFKRELRDDRILFFLPRGKGPGIYEFQYRLRAVTQGKFCKAAPRLEGLYQPGLVMYGPKESPIEVR